MNLKKAGYNRQIYGESCQNMSGWFSNSKRATCLKGRPLICFGLIDYVDATGYKALWYQHLFQVCLPQTYLPGAITIRPT